MISSLLIANRGEIACRVIATARAMGLKTIAVYSEADAQALHVKAADEAHYLGPSPASESYLRQDLIIDIARKSGADAIHPGYGFLSENAAFARACNEADIVFVGPPADAITAMGLKDRAKALMEEAGVPVVPGYHGDNQDTDYLARKAEEIGYPVLIKAVAGGGGKGMRRVDAAEDFAKALAAAQREAKAAFGDDHVLIEKFVARPRHIEVQVFADAHGNAVHLFERDCSVQRRHQKVVEEAPAPGMPEDMRAAMGKAACDAARAIGYRGAGTVEFITDASDGLRADRFYFMEMNTRLQVEHPVTEMITGQDLVEWQLKVAAGEPLPLAQGDVGISGHALEVRLYAEDPDKQFFPSTGPLKHFSLPEEGSGLRIDAGVTQGDNISIYYDPMIAKLITWGDTRDQARLQLIRAVESVQVTGVTTNAGFLRDVLSHPVFAAGEMDTGFIDAHSSDLVGTNSEPTPGDVLMAGLALAIARAGESGTPVSEDPHSPWNDTSGWRLSGTAHETLHLVRRDTDHAVDVTYTASGVEASVGDLSGAAGELGSGPEFQATIGGVRRSAGVHIEGRTVSLMRGGRSWQFVSPDPLDVASADAAASGGVSAPMTGKITQVWVKPGDRVSRGAPLIALEAMKMEHTLAAPADVAVAEVLAGPGDQVEGGALLVAFEQASD